MSFQLLWLFWIIPAVVLAIMIVAKSLGWIKNDSLDMWPLGFVALGFVTVLVLGAGIITNAVNASSKNSCRREGELAGYAWQYHLNGGCYLDIKNQYVPDAVWINNTGN